MTLQERIENEYVVRAKARDAEAVSVLRMLRSALKNARIESGKDLDDAAAQDVVAREAKKLRDAVDAYRAGGRDDLAAQAMTEIAFMEGFLPEQLDDAALAEIVVTVLAGFPDATAKDFGRVMSDVMRQAKGRADGARVSAAVKRALEPSG